MQKNIITFQYITALLLWFFCVIFLWNFTQSGISALGINGTLFGFGCLYLLIWSLDNKILFIKKNLYWLIPFLLIILSYSFYEIPFLKEINIWLLPLITLFFFWYATSNISLQQEWSWQMIKKIIFRKLHINESVSTMNQYIQSWENNKIALYKKIAAGVWIFFLINIFIISLLMWADTHFKQFIGHFWDFINMANINKTLIGLLLSVIFLSFANLWNHHPVDHTQIEKKQLDSVISGIVLGGTLFTYILFIGVQLDTLLTNTQWESVQNIANLAKTWFWQLFTISIVNIIFFFIYYKKTNPLVQKLLGVFIFASVIILFSAANKMFDYTSIYGLSYEKFFASYTILYFWILFILMIGFILLNKKIDILKITTLLALWMYAGIHIIPTESIIFQVNTHISLQKNSVIQKYQSHMLSIDILQSVESMKQKDIYKNQNWQEWSEKKIKKSQKKYWYEKNIQDFLIR